MSKESDQYEQFVQTVIQALVAAGVEVNRQTQFEGIRSRRTIKVDVSFRQQIVGGAEILVLVECKCYSHSVTVDDVEEFCTKLTDIGAHKGIMVTTVGYQDGCKKTATGFGVALAILTKEKLPGELSYVVNTSVKSGKQEDDEFWQGNVWGPHEGVEGGLRFDSLPQLLSWMYWVKESDHRISDNDSSGVSSS